MTKPALPSKARAEFDALPPINQREFVLATDLDGTFLGGSEAERLALYALIEANRERVGLVFVTGRDPAFIAELCRDTPVPWPEYAIGDVGTTIAQIFPDAETPVQPIPALEAHIENAWSGKSERVRATLDDHPGLTPQPTAFRFRMSYDMDPITYCPSAEAKVAALGVDHLISDNRFFDVLPKGVSKGPSLLRLIDHLGIANDRVLAAGDTLNDLSMLQTGLPAVAVGGSEAGLIAKVQSLETVYRAERKGAGGIAEAMAALNLFSSPGGASNVV